ncbi:MAG: hypothetical protein GXP62_06890 [Oligoflexia bacterium]|nr:hypothetical protein [Oligoflexia bacterium]
MLMLVLFVLNCLAADEGYAMNDVGGQLLLPRGWEMQEWSDWNFKAKSDRGVLMRLYLTPFQVVPSVQAAQAWAGLAREHLEDQGGSDFADPETAVATVKLADGEVQAATIDLTFTLEKQATKGVLHGVALQSKGQVVHVETIAAARNDARARAGLAKILAGLMLEKKPDPIGDSRVESEIGFAFTAPPGWRAPLRNELAATRKVTSKVGEKTLDPKQCAAIIRPPALGDPDVIFACDLYKFIGVVDQYSFDGVEADVHDLFFGRSDKPVAAAQRVDIGDRLGFLYSPPVAGMPVRLAVVPFDKGLVVLWGMGKHLDDAELDTAVRAVLATMEFTGPDGGAPIVALDQRFSYYLSYHPTSPIVIGPALVLVLLVGGIIVLVMRRKPAFDDL